MCNPNEHAPIIATDRLTRGRTRMRQTVGTLDRRWYVAAQSHQVTAKKPWAAEILEEKIVLFRGKRGEAVALVDRCLHRNAPLSEGDLFDGCIGCPYHGWTYDASGHVVNVPAEGPDGRALPLSIERFPVRESDGLVWVWMGGAEHPPEAYPDRVPFAMPHHDEAGWGAYYMETDFDNGVTALVENFMDVPHTVWVHRGWFRNRSRREVAMKVERTASSVLVTYDQPQDEIGFTSRILNPKGLPMTHTDRFYMPNVTRVDYLYGDPEAPETGFVITSQCTPISPLRAKVYTLISFKLPFVDVRPVLPLIEGFLGFYTRRVIGQDVDIMAVHGRNVGHYGGRAYVSTPADTLHVFIESLRDHAEAGEVEPLPEPTVAHAKFWI